MLKLIHVQARLGTKNGQAVVRQMRADEGEDRQRADEVIAVFRQALADGLTREKLDARLEEYADVRLDYREIDGLAKVICDSFATFEAGSATLLPKAETVTAKVDSNEVPLDAALTALPPTDKDEDESQPNPTMSAFRLATWREAARPEFYPFYNPGLTVALKPGVQSLRRAAAAHDEELLARLLPAPTRATILERAADRAGLIWLRGAEPPQNVGDLLFADVKARHRLVALSPDLTVENLLNRYNVELLRGVLYLAPRLRIRVYDKYKDLFKFIKLFGLMHDVKPLPRPGQTPNPDHELSENEIGGYEIVLEGAASPFLARSDRRYGIQFAKFLPALLLCEAQWELEAELVFAWAGGGSGQTAKGKIRLTRVMYKLGPQPHLRTHFKGSGEFDSLLEAGLAAAFEERFKTTTRKPDSVEPPPDETKPNPKRRKPKKAKPDERQGWTISREDRIINVFDTVMIPDFAFEHTDGRRALLEVVGFWERGYLERKIAKLNRAGRQDFIVLVSERTRCGRENFLVKGQEPPYQLIFFKGTPRLGPIMEALEKCAV